MEIDGRAARLLRYLAGRVRMTLGNNAPRVASALRMSEPELRRAAGRLFALGLAEDAPIDARNRAWAVTDAGLGYLAARGLAPSWP